MLKVYGITSMQKMGQVRVIAAVKNKKEFSQLLGYTVYDASMTNNEDEVRTAMAEPHIVFWRPLDSYRGPFRKLHPLSVVWDELVNILNVQTVESND